MTIPDGYVIYFVGYVPTELINDLYTAWASGHTLTFREFQALARTFFEENPEYVLGNNYMLVHDPKALGLS